MKIKVNRFYLRYEGKMHGPGSILELDDVAAKEIISRSNGDISVYHDDSVVTEEKPNGSQGDGVEPHTESASPPNGKELLARNKENSTTTETDADSKGDNKATDTASIDKSGADIKADSPTTLPDADPTQAIADSNSKNGKKK